MATPNRLVEKSISISRAKSFMPILATKSLHKRFPGVQALDGVDFELEGGEIHALMGENGAGKSTLIKVITGVHGRDGGDVQFDGRSIKPTSPAQAEKLGISAVYQEVNLIPRLSVAENIFLGRQPKRASGIIDWPRLYQMAQELLARLGVDLNVRNDLADYSIAIQQMIAIARGIALQAKVLILDEPTSSLDEKEVTELFKLMRHLRGEGMAIIFVSHFLDQIYEISDRITVLRNGQRIGTWEVGRLDRLELVQHMLGRRLPDRADRSAGTELNGRGRFADQAPVVVARALGRRAVIEPFDLEIFPGEVIGLAGLLGSGRTEIGRLIFGIDNATTGSLEVNGQTVSNWSPRQAVDAGIAWCPEDRKRDGVIAPLSVRENIVLAMQAGRALMRPLSVKVENYVARRYVDELAVKTPSIETRVGTLSGGNQQKVLLGRWLAMEPQLLILDEPTRGIDVGAKAEIEALIVKLSQSGVAVLLISSELEDLVRCCSRIVVMRDRKVIGNLTGADIDEPTIMRMIARYGE